MIAMSARNAYFRRLLDEVWSGKQVKLETSVMHPVWGELAMHPSQANKPYTFVHIRLGKCVVEMFDKHESGTGRVAIYGGDQGAREKSIFDFQNLWLNEPAPVFMSDMFEGMTTVWNIGQDSSLTVALWAASSKSVGYELTVVLGGVTVAVRRGIAKNEDVRGYSLIHP